ncbi:unnamed protein product [Sphenostylis stenocarpa]|uniref:Uncharacterized protein n=1 Tax=Sphenostylis stenocarpa TaxID=92480 RepID=A0AA86SVQ2_9FABA|nr:unnamed protein product [Sphenostylis stenocarpa]
MVHIFCWSGGGLAMFYTSNLNGHTHSYACTQTPKTNVPTKFYVPTMTEKTQNHTWGVPPTIYQASCWWDKVTPKLMAAGEDPTYNRVALLCFALLESFS